jgi:hypothetical protein
VPALLLVGFALWLKWCGGNNTVEIAKFNYDLYLIPHGEDETLNLTTRINSIHILKIIFEFKLEIKFQVPG